MLPIYGAKADIPQLLNSTLVFGGNNMNIYLITEDGENFCIKAKTADEAINVCEKSYIDEILETQPRSSLESEKRILL